MELSDAWTGRTACALQEALRLSNDLFARRLGIGVRTVAAWHQKPDLRPQSGIQQALDDALANAPQAAKERFAQLAGLGDQRSAGPELDVVAVAKADRTVTADPYIGPALEWLDHSARWEPGTARKQVAARLASLRSGDLQAIGTRRRQVGRQQLVLALSQYYGDQFAEHGRYIATYGADHSAETTILTRPDWLGLECPLTAATDRLTVTNSAVNSTTSSGGDAAESAAQRLALTLAVGGRLVNMPLYYL